MMISPESYVELHIKDKNKEQVIIEIGNLKKSIKEIKRDLKKPRAQRCVVKPGPDVKLYCYKEYLKAAEKYLKESF